MSNRLGRATIAAVAIGLCGIPAVAQQRTILAIGAHAADMELTAGALLAHQHLRGDRVVLLHLTLGEGGNPKMTPAEYGAQKRKEAEAVAKALGAEVIFGPYQDGTVPNDEDARRYVADVMRQVKPTLVITHWKNSMHQDHRNTSAIVSDAILLAALDGVKLAHPAHRGIRGLYYADNWEDPEDFRRYLYVDVSDAFEQWKQAIREYQMVRGGVSSFAYFDYYTAHLQALGALSGRKYAVALNIEEYGKRRVLDALQ
jgi:N-acetylglucosamine malate deacetylase 1